MEVTRVNKIPRSPVAASYTDAGEGVSKMKAPEI